MTDVNKLSIQEVYPNITQANINVCSDALMPFQIRLASMVTMVNHAAQGSVEYVVQYIQKHTGMLKSKIQECLARINDFIQKICSGTIKNTYSSEWSVTAKGGKRVNDRAQKTYYDEKLTKMKFPRSQARTVNHLATSPDIRRHFMQG